jgi:hypothetical protein
MADSRSVMQEFRLLEQRRLAGALTAAETARHAELRDLVGIERPSRGGFDVTAAAAQLRESLLPAGLRSRPLDSPVPPPAPAPMAWTPPAPAPVAPAPEPDALFDPSSLGDEVRPQAWNPEAPGYDPDAPYDEAAWIAAGYDPNATYDWSALGGGEPAAPAEAEAAPGAAPLQFGEYDETAAPAPSTELLEPLEPLELVEPPAPAPEADGGWFGEGGAAAEVMPPLVAPAFGEYDAPPPSAPVVSDAGEPFYGGPEGESLPGGTPLELGDATADWPPEGALDTGFELASGGSFGEPAASPQAAPWSTPAPAASGEAWESAPALDLSTPFEPVPVPAPRPPDAPAADPLERLEPEPALDSILEDPLELAPEAGPAPALEALPAEPSWPVDFADAPLDEAGDGEPISLDDLDAAVEIDVPSEVASAHDAPPPSSAAVSFDAPVEGHAEPATSQPEAAPVAAERAPPPAPEVAPEEARPGGVVSGAHRVVIHTLDGLVLRGTLTEADLEEPELELESGTAGETTPVGTAGIKAIFFMLAPGEEPQAPLGKRVRVTFRDGRQVAGFSPDYREGGVGFFMFPADTRTNTARIWVYQAAVKQVAVS